MEQGSFTSHVGNNYTSACASSFQLEKSLTPFVDFSIFPIYAPNIKNGITFLLKDNQPFTYDPITEIVQVYATDSSGIHKIMVWYNSKRKE